MIDKGLYNTYFLPEYLKTNISEIDNYPEKKIYYDYTLGFNLDEELTDDIYLIHLIGGVYYFNFENKFNYYLNCNLDTNEFVKNLFPNFSVLYNFTDNISVFLNNKNGVNLKYLDESLLCFSTGINYKYSDTLNIIGIYDDLTEDYLFGLKQKVFFFDSKLIFDYNLSISKKNGSVYSNLKYKKLNYGFSGHSTDISGQKRDYYGNIISIDYTLFNKYDITTTFEYSTAQPATATTEGAAVADAIENTKIKTTSLDFKLNFK